MAENHGVTHVTRTSGSSPSVSLVALVVGAVMLAPGLVPSAAADDDQCPPPLVVGATRSDGPAARSASERTVHRWWSGGPGGGGPASWSSGADDGRDDRHESGGGPDDPKPAADEPAERGEDPDRPPCPVPEADGDHRDPDRPDPDDDADGVDPGGGGPRPEGEDHPAPDDPGRDEPGPDGSDGDAARTHGAQPEPTDVGSPAREAGESDQRSSFPPAEAVGAAGSIDAGATSGPSPAPEVPISGPAERRDAPDRPTVLRPEPEGRVVERAVGTPPGGSATGFMTRPPAGLRSAFGAVPPPVVLPVAMTLLVAAVLLAQGRLIRRPPTPPVPTPAGGRRLRFE
jgi:hypothetical protein